MSTTTAPAAVKNNVVWFEIPSSDFERAVAFYEKIFERPLQRGNFMDTALAIFAYEKPAVSGCVIKEEALRPGESGTVIYLNADGIFDEVVGRVAGAGGKVLAVVDLPPGMGRSARIIDTEGNTIGLHTY